MPRDIFTDVTRPPVRLGSQAWYTVPASILTHAGLVAIVVLIPLVATDAVPIPTRDIVFAAPTPPPAPPPPPERRPAAAAANQTAAPSNRDVAPAEAPDKIGVEMPGPPGPPDIGDVKGGFGAAGAIGGTAILGVPDPPAPAVVTPVRAGGKIKYPEKLRDVRPIYPQIAVLNKIEGRVIIEAIIGTDGRVKDARILRSIPLLDRAALDAVNQWLFSPTTLNGAPVPVIITVTVDFKLN
jgi:protein TonB